MDKLDVQVQELNFTNSEAWAELAWYECVEIAEQILPILVVSPEDKILTGNKIAAYLTELIKIGC